MMLIRPGILTFGAAITLVLNNAYSQPPAQTREVELCVKFMNPAGNGEYRFRMAFHNRGAKSLLVHIGYSLSDRAVLEGFGFDIESGDGHRYEAVMKYQEPGAAGTYAPLLVPLPVDSTFSVVVPEGSFRVLGSNASLGEILAGAVSLRANWSGPGHLNEGSRTYPRPVTVRPQFGFLKGNLTSQTLKLKGGSSVQSSACE